ncbi:MAG: oligosaccharide flippase family protein [Candidatus Bathyarchaeota archaeon]|nr:MAG: oligosaccharide flippase family protein [Candidatus Bathyarchaeota archaeon]
MQSSETHVARGATFVFLQGFIHSGLGVLYVWFLLHTKEITGQILFTQENWGLSTILSFVLTLTSTVGILSLRAASVKYISQYLAERKVDRAKSVVSRVLQVSAITSLVEIALLFGLANTLSTSLASTDPNAILIFQLLPLSSVFQILYFQALGFLQGLQRLREFAAIGILYSLTQYSVAILFVYIGYGVLGIVISWIFALALACILSFSVAFRHIGFSRRPHELKPLLSFSFPIYVSGLLTFVVNWVDQIFVFGLMDVEALGVYNIAVRASFVPNLVSIALIISLFPKMSEMRSKLGTESLRDAFRASTRYASLIGFPVSLLVAALAYPIIVLFATVRFSEAAIPLVVMCVAAIPTILGSAILPALYTLEKTKIASLIGIVSIFLEGFVSYVLLSRLGADLSGVAFSRLVAALAAFVLGTYVVRKSLKVKFDKEAIWKSAISSLVMVFSILAMELLRYIAAPSSYEFLVLRVRQLPVYAIVGVAVYVLSLVALKAVKGRDIKLLDNYLPSRLRWIARLAQRITRVEDQ